MENCITNWHFDEYSLSIIKYFDFDSQKYKLFYHVPSCLLDDLDKVSVEFGCYNVTQQGMCFILLPSPRLLETATTNTLRSTVNMNVGTKSIGIVDDKMKDACLHDVVVTCSEILHFVYGV